MALKENYKDDILDASQNTRRKYKMIQNADGTVSFEDVTSYSQNGDNFSAADINAITAKLNEIGSGSTVRYVKKESDNLQVLDNGKWVETRLKAGLSSYYLFLPNDNAGGFVAIDRGVTFSYPSKSPNLSIGTAMSISIESESNSYGSAVSGLVDITNYSKLVMKHKTTTGNANSELDTVSLFVTADKSTSPMNAMAIDRYHMNSLLTEGTITLDVSSISGEVYVGIEVACNGKETAVEVYEMYLE